MRVAISADIETGGFLVPQVDRHRIGVLFAKTGVNHRRAKISPAEIFGIPPGSGQRANDAGGKDDAVRCVIQCLFLPIA